MTLLDHFRPPLSLRRHWHGFDHAWATCISSDLNRRLSKGYFAEANVPFGIEIDLAEILIFHEEGEPTLAGAIELTSPANKDRFAHRGAFVARCASILQQGVGLVIVEVVTDLRANLREELLTQLGTPSLVPVDSDLHAAAYRPIRRDGQTSLDIWQEPLAGRENLPTLPLWLRGNLCMPVDLATTYERTCSEQRIESNGNSPPT